ncbi:GNAT family N-acetyltransferase [Saccharothrix syringae]|uniref:GNAT family N-acetyltransferase n=1 Tax=Saccharothrix syringae TaxID=103733 RepID=UPI00068CC0C8|nr:GNAT family N-acetyltransferase [Saccharothrix syringae]
MILLRAVDDEGLERLLALAVADADPADVMPPGWSADRLDEFRGFYRGFRRDAYEVVADGRTVGMARLTAGGEAGLWLARAARGAGLGLEVLRALVEEAPRRDVFTVVAHTTTDNVAAVRILTRAGAVLEVADGHVTARIAVPLEPPPEYAGPPDVARESGDGVSGG